MQTEAHEIMHRNPGRPRDEDAKRRLLQAALEMLEEFGFANTTAEAIAARAKTGKATLYRWWSGKHALLIEAFRQAVTQELYLPQGGDLQEEVRLQIRNLVEFLTGPRARMFKAFIVAAQYDPEAAKAFQTSWREPCRLMVKNWLERYRDTKLRQDLDLDVVIDAMCGPVYYRLLLAPDTTFTNYADVLADILLPGILRTAFEKAASP